MKMNGKTKKLAGVLFMSLSLLCFSACKPKEKQHKKHTEWSSDTTGHWHKCDDCETKFDFGTHNYKDGQKAKVCEECKYELDYTLEENFAYWIKGRDFIKDYDGDYTSYVDRKIYENDVLSSYNYLNESKSGNKYFSDYVAYDLNDKNEFEQSYLDLIVFKEVDDNGVTRNKEYHKIVDDEGEKITGRYVSPTQADKEVYELPRDGIDGLYISESNTYEDLIKDIKDGFKNDEEFGVEPSSIELIRRDDGSVSLVITLTAEADLESSSEDEPIKGKYEIYYDINVKDGVVQNLDLGSTSYAYYKDETKNSTEKLVHKQKIEYSFDEEKYNSLDITTERTTNEYYGVIDFFIENLTLPYHCREYLVGYDVTASEMSTYLATLPGFMAAYSMEIETDKLFAFYKDEAMTQEITNMTMEEKMTIYAKFTPPENCSVILTAFKTKSGNERVHIAYLVDKGYKFTHANYFPQYSIYEIDGKENSEDNVEFVCEENRAYVVRYDTSLDM